MSAFTIDFDLTEVDDGPFSESTDNNWDDVTPVARVDQKTGLSARKITLKPMKNALRKAEDYDIWKRVVEANLKLRGLDGLIDYNLPRPTKNHKQSQRWFNASKAIGEWLIANISTDIHSRIQARCTLSFADVIWEAIYQEMRGYSIYDEMEQVNAFSNLRRTDFPTATAYIDEYCARYVRLKERRLEAEPYVAMLLMLKQVHQIDVRDSVLASLEEKNHNAETFTYGLFCTYTQNLRDRLSSREAE